MEGSTDEGLLRDAAGDHVVELADHRAVTTDLEVSWDAGEAGARLALEVRRVDHPLGVVLTLRGELELATVPVLQERLGSRHARQSGGGHRPVSAEIHRLVRS